MVFMNRSRRKPLLSVRPLFLAMAVCAICALLAFSQEGKGPRTLEEGKRPRSIDEGETTVTRRPLAVKKNPVPPPTPSRTAYNWIVIRPEAAYVEATVLIDGKVVPKSK